MVEKGTEKEQEGMMRDGMGCRRIGREGKQSLKNATLTPDPERRIS